MRRIYEPQNLMEAELLLGMLASEGVEARLDGRDLVGGGRRVAGPRVAGFDGGR